MADTLNYAWTKPIEGGSTGAWDTILNEAIDDIDAQVKIVEDKSDDALAENLAFPLVPAFTAIWAAFNGAEPDTVRRLFNTGAAGGLQLTGTGAETLTYVLPISGLAPGMRITGFRSFGQEPADTVITVSLMFQGTDGIDTVIGSLSHGTSLAIVSNTGLSHDVVADRAYFFAVTIIRTTGSNQPLLCWMQPTVVRV